MSYPIRLLPRPFDKIIKQIDQRHILCRWVSPSLKLKDSNGSLSAEAIEEKRLPGYSTNKIPPSVVEDVKIAFHNDEFEKNWSEGEIVAPPSDEDYYTTDRNYFLFRIEDIYKFSKPYSFPPDNPVHNYYFQIDTVHKPLRANISHFEFNIQHFSSSGNPEKGPSPTSKTFKRVIAADIRSRLMKIAKFDLEDFATEPAAVSAQTYYKLTKRQWLFFLAIGVIVILLLMYSIF